MSAHWHVYFGHDCYTYPTGQCFPTLRDACKFAERETTCDTRELRRNRRVVIPAALRAEVGCGWVLIEKLSSESICELCSVDN